MLVISVLSGGSEQPAIRNHRADSSRKGAQTNGSGTGGQIDVCPIYRQFPGHDLSGDLR
jgi:hypothetical protein